MKYDVAIVGAGPAGATAAKFLSENGHKVVLIDKEKFPRYKPCGGGLPVRIFERFPYIKDKKYIDSYVFGGFIYSHNLKYSTKMTKDYPLLAMVLRNKFDFELVKLAIEKGATFMDGKTVVDIKISEDDVSVQLDDNTIINSDMIIGADGIWSIVAKKLGLRLQGYNAGKCVFKEYKLDKETIEQYFEKERLVHLHARFNKIKGYGWVFPKKEHVNIGIIETILSKNQEKSNLLDEYKNYFHTLKETNIIPKDIDIGKLDGGALPIVPLNKTYAERAVLIGDAAGFINPATGEGIYYAMISGQIAAKIISEALKNNRTDEQFLSKFQKAWKKDFGKEIYTIFKFAKKQKGKPNDKIIKYACKDEKIAELLLGLMTDQISLDKCKWELVKRYIVASIKFRFSK